MAESGGERAPSHPAAGVGATQNSPLGDLSGCHSQTVTSHACLALVKFKFCAEVRKKPRKARGCKLPHENASEVSIVRGCKNPLN